MQPYTVLARDAVPEEDVVPLEGINCPNRGGLPVGPDTEVRVRDTTLQAGSTIL